MGLLRKLFGKKQAAPARPPAAAASPRRYPTRSMIDDPELRTVADFARHYPLPAGFEYRQRGQEPADTVVVRQSDDQEFIFLVEEGILSFDVPRQKEDGTWGSHTTDILKVP